jgi:hypothetical protein
MTGNYTSPFDDLLAENQKQLDDVLGGTSSALPTATEVSPAATIAEPQPIISGPKTVAGTVNGVPFRLTV